MFCFSGSAVPSNMGMSSGGRPTTPNEIKKSPPSGSSKFSPPTEPLQMKKSPPAEPMKSPTHTNRTNSRTKVVCGKKKEPTYEVSGKKVSGRYSPHSKKSHSPSFGSSTR